jgi:hypothetical protein
MKIFTFLMLCIYVINCNNNSINTCEKGIIKNNLCCHVICDTCGECEEGTDDITNSINNFCCKTNIENSGRLCNETEAPCIITNTRETGIFNNIFNSLFKIELNSFQIIIILIAIGIFLLFCCFTCGFGDYCCVKNPPVDYDDIIGNFR